MFLNFRYFGVVLVGLVIFAGCESEIAKRQRLEKERTDPNLISSKQVKNLISLYGGIKAYKSVFGKYDDIAKMSDVKVVKVDEKTFILDKTHKCFKITISGDITVKAINQENNICKLSHTKAKTLIR